MYQRSKQRTRRSPSRNYHKKIFHASSEDFNYLGVKHIKVAIERLDISLVSLFLVVHGIMVCIAVQKSSIHYVRHACTTAGRKR